MLSCYTKSIKPVGSICYVYCCFIKNDQEDIIARYFKVTSAKNQLNADLKTVLYAKDIMRKYKVNNYRIYNENDNMIDNIQDETIFYNDVSKEINVIDVENIISKYLNQITVLHKICENSLSYCELFSKDYDKLKEYATDMQNLNIDLDDILGIINKKVDEFENATKENIDNCNKLMMNLVTYINNDIDIKINQHLKLTSNVNKDEKIEKDDIIDEVRKSNITSKEIKVIKDEDEIENIINGKSDKSGIEVSSSELDMLKRDDNSKIN